jgi:mono/diheme cytochrome c family protein
MTVAVAGFTIVAAFYYTLHAQSSSRSVWDGVYTEDQAKRGQTESARSCAQCHGPALGGGEMAPPLTGPNFLSNWNGLSASDLFERIRTTMPQDKPGTLKPEATADVLAYIFSANQFPTGKDELPSAPDALKQIQIDAAKPEKK